MPHELTRPEVQERFLRQVWAMVDYWAAEDRKPDPRDKLEGLAFSILVILDGESTALPPFAVAPSPHPDDREFHQQRDEDWFPESGCDIAGNLHERFHELNPNKRS
jgi:hypothetical protein